MNRTSPTCSLLAILLLAACMNKVQAPAPVTLYGAEAGAGSAGVHTVVGNETLWNVSQRYQLAMRDIAAANNLSPPFDLNPGQRLRLPPPRQYKARAGDSLYTVSRLFSVSTSDIAHLNNLREPYTLKGGEVLRLPTLTRDTVPSATQLAKAPLQPGTMHTPPAPTINNAPIKKEVLPPPTPVPAQQPQNVLTAPQPIEVAKAPAAPVKKTPITAQVPKRESNRFLRPVEGKILSSYGPKKDGLHNDGINIASAPGVPVRAAENGVVVYAGDELKASGNLIIIRHQDRWMTAYAHMDKLLIKRGETVRRGQTIGTVGSTGSVDKPQLHFEVRRGTEALNPQLYLERKAES